jgi:hypothetical protein
LGGVRFSCPEDLLKALADASGIDAAIETGTYKAEGALALREAVGRVWSVELDGELYSRAVSRHGARPGITFVHGSSDKALPELLSALDEPAILWLDAHGGMVSPATDEVFNPAEEATQCPVIGELNALRGFSHAAGSCVLIDDARAFLGPLPGQRRGDWPTLLEILDLLRNEPDPYVTILDDVIISVPSALRPIVNRWWLDQIQDRQGRDGQAHNIWEAHNPTPMIAARRLVKSLTPAPVRRIYDRYR